MPRPKVYSPRRFKGLIEWLVKNGTISKPRGLTTIEVINTHLVVKDPQDRIVFDAGRKMNIAFAIVDFVHMMMGRDDIEFLEWVVPKIRDFVDPDNEETIGGAYGPRIVYGEGPIGAPTEDQIADVISKLKADPSSRQAVVSIYHGPTDLNILPHIVPCTISLQFLIRDKRLHLIATMRSNDITWGLTYDVFNFTMIQEYVATQLKVPLGCYFHNAGSLHLYKERDDAMIKALRGKRHTLKMPSMPLTFLPANLEQLILTARDLSSRKFWESLRLYDQYTQDLALALRYWAARKEAPYEAEAAYRANRDPAIRKMLRLWPIKK